MDLPVKLNQKYKTATVVFAGGDDFTFVEQWRDTLGNDLHPHRVDAVDFARLAQFRYLAHSSMLPYARTIEEFEDYINDNPVREVGCLVFLKCDWFPDCDVLGLSHFRRTWANRVVLDYLCAHPFITKRPASYPNEVNGVGSALLYFVAQVAKACRSEVIWGEATQNSCKFYKHVLQLDSVEDLIYAPRERFLEFCERLESNWAKRDSSKPNPVLDEIYKIEAETPPFVGNKTAVYSPPRKLVEHFLDLPLHEKIEVARALGCSEGDDSKHPDAELFRRIFKYAAENGKLPNLWSEVETRHTAGEPECNPFQKPI